jgi:hypothetical protein
MTATQEAAEMVRRRGKVSTKRSTKRKRKRERVRVVKTLNGKSRVTVVVFLEFPPRPPSHLQAH